MVGGLIVLSGWTMLGLSHLDVLHLWKESLVALAGMSLLAWLYLERWSRCGRTDYVFKYTERLQ